MNHRRIQLWVVILVDGREVLGRHVLGEDDILDAYGDTMKWASLISGSGIELFGGLQDELWIEVCPAMDQLISLLHSSNQCLGTDKVSTMIGKSCGLTTLQP